MVRPGRQDWVHKAGPMRRGRRGWDGKARRQRLALDMTHHFAEPLAMYPARFAACSCPGFAGNLASCSAILGLSTCLRTSYPHGVWLTAVSEDSVACDAAS